MKDSTAFLSLVLLIIVGIVAVIAYEQWPFINALREAAASAVQTGTIDIDSMVPETIAPLDLIAAADRKIANGLTFLVVVAGLLPVLLTYLEGRRSKELKEFEQRAEARAETRRTELRDELEKARAQTQDLIRMAVREEIQKVEQAYASDISRDIIRTVEEETRQRMAFLTERDLTAELVLMSFIRNDLPEGASAKQIGAVFELQQLLRRLADGDARDALVALRKLSGKVPKLTRVTRAQVRQHLERIDGKGAVAPLQNQMLVRQIIGEIEELDG